MKPSFSGSVTLTLPDTVSAEESSVSICDDAISIAPETEWHRNSRTTPLNVMLPSVASALNEDSVHLSHCIAPETLTIFISSAVRDVMNASPFSILILISFAEKFVGTNNSTCSFSKWWFHVHLCSYSCLISSVPESRCTHGRCFSDRDE